MVAKHTWRSFLDDNLVGRAAELGFYFIFALFPSLFTATSLLGLAARSASHIYYSLLSYLSIVIPHDAMGMVLGTFNETTAAATRGSSPLGWRRRFGAPRLGSPRFRIRSMSSTGSRRLALTLPRDSPPSE
ncbi:hypothetical protein [Tunturiibacter gelidiferens]|uniref:hypothetical protein n=1 Tax=Tunturiibacter gelidiferens TaxID=3069689 RepID=UPI003D9BFC9B